MTNYSPYSVLRDMANTYVAGRTFRAALVDATYTPNSNDEFLSSYAASEIATGGYSRIALAAPVVTLEPSGIVTIAFENPTWSALTAGVSPRRCIIYDDTTASDATRQVIQVIDFGSAVATNGSSYTVTVSGPLQLSTTSA